MGSIICKNKDNTTQPFLQPVKELRIVSLGKTGAGKSHTGNTILCNQSAFQRNCSPASVTQKCESVIATVKGRNIKCMDTPGFFDTFLSEERLKSENLRCVVKCAPGPHVFLIILKVERYTYQEEEIVKKITEAFGEDALKYAIVLFTHGDNLNDGQTIEQFVRKNSKLQELVNKCGNHCHVIDNKYWNEKKKGYRSNRVQVESLMKTIDELRTQNGGEYYTNEMLQEVQRNIDNEMQEIRAETNDERTERQIREEAEEMVYKKLLVRLAGVTGEDLLGALLGIKKLVLFLAKRKNRNDALPTVAETEFAAVPRLELVDVTAGAAEKGCSAGAIKGVRKAYDAVEGEQTVSGAIKKAAHACTENE